MTNVRRRRSSVMLVGLACAVLAAVMLLPRLACAGTAPCGSTFPQCNGSCPPNQACVGLGGGACVCFPTGCCQVNAQTCENDAFEALCPGQFVAAGTCGVDCMPQIPTSAPAISPQGAALAFVALIAIGAVALLRRRSTTAA